MKSEKDINTFGDYDILNLHFIFCEKKNEKIFSKKLFIIYYLEFDYFRIVSFYGWNIEF